MLLMFIPIGIVIDVSEKVNKMIENHVAFSAIARYYLDFTIYFANLLFPIFLFLSVIWFTSKLANNTEIIAILSSGISFSRFLRPYIIGATIVSLFALVMTIYLVPNASAGFKSFRYIYLTTDGVSDMRDNTNVFRQTSKDEYIFVSNFNEVSKMAFNFSMEKFEGDKLKYKLQAGRIKWNPTQKNYTLYNYSKRKVGQFGDIIESGEVKDTVFKFDLEDETATAIMVNIKAETGMLYFL